MPDEPVEKGSFQDWLVYARSDLELARRGKSPAILLETLCFHAQQAAEKALKAVLIHLGIPT
jgi:HEPN domain-containing protein